jgi:heat shock protein HslJ
MRIAVLLTVLGLALAGCGDDQPASPIEGHPATLAGTSWIVIAIGGRPPAPAGAPTIAFDATQAQGSGGCNHFGGRYTYDPATGGLRFADMGMTAMACAEAARNATETAFIQLLGQPSLVAQLGPDGHLILAGAAGRIELEVNGPRAD